MLWILFLMLSILFLMLRWYFDFADGIFARKYNDTTTFGDYYDHIVDITFTILPIPDFSMPGISIFVIVCDAWRCLLNAGINSSISVSSKGPPGGPDALLILSIMILIYFWLFVF